MIDAQVHRPGGKFSQFVLLLAASTTLIAVSENADAQTRSFDGTSNNATHDLWGSAGSSYTRMGGALYDNGMSTPRNGSNARDISNALGTQSPALSARNLSSFFGNGDNFSIMILP